MPYKTQPLFPRHNNDNKGRRNKFSRQQDISKLSCILRISRAHTYSLYQETGKFVRRHRKLHTLRSFLNILERRTATVNRGGVLLLGYSGGAGKRGFREGASGYKRTLITSSCPDFSLSLSLSPSLSLSLYLSLSVNVI